MCQGSLLYHSMCNPRRWYEVMLATASTFSQFRSRLYHLQQIFPIHGLRLPKYPGCYIFSSILCIEIPDQRKPVAGYICIDSASSRRITSNPCDIHQGHRNLVSSMRSKSRYWTTLCPAVSLFFRGEQKNHQWWVCELEACRDSIR
jgi:hypothetical protein